MFYRRLGQTDIELSVLGLGTVKFGRNRGVKYPHAFSLPDDPTLAHLLDCAQDIGMNLLDTAPAYGDSESRLGTLLKGRRNHWLICSKAGESFNPETGQSRFDFSPEALTRSVRQSLARLGTDHLDILLIHSNGEDQRLIHEFGVLEVLADLKRRGMIRAGGMSTKTVSGGIAALDGSDCAMVTLNPDHLEEVPVIQHAETTHKGILVKKAFNSGQIPGNDARNWARRALELSLSMPGVSTVVMGTISPDHLLANARMVNDILANTDSGPVSESSQAPND